MDPTAHQTIALNEGADLQGFRQALRVLIWSEIPPGQITWATRRGASCFGDQAPAPYGEAGKPIILPRAVGDLIGRVVCHSDPRKYELLYALIWRMKGPKDPDPHAFTRIGEPPAQELHRLAGAVEEDVRQMCEGVRFREVHDQAAGDRFVAWFEPKHFIIEAIAPALVKRFGQLDWTVLTPKGCLWWDRQALAVSPPAARANALEAEAARMSWRLHRASVFNPSRTKMADTRWREQLRGWTERSPTAEPWLNGGPENGLSRKDNSTPAAERPD